MASNWWVDETGINYLKGSELDPTNPIRLDDETIIHFLQRIPQAVDDFYNSLPTLLPEEQTRLQNLIEDNPMATLCIADPKTKADNFQKVFNTAGIYTVGPKGGSGYGR